MNVEVDEAAEERKGGAGHLGKMLLSAGDKQVYGLVSNGCLEADTSSLDMGISHFVTKLL